MVDGMNELGAFPRDTVDGLNILPGFKEVKFSWMIDI